MTELKRYLKNKIKKLARKTCLKTPRITELKILNHKELCGGGFSYETATCKVTDVYVCPLTRKTVVDIYNAVYDGVELKMSLLHKFA